MTTYSAHHHLRFETIDSTPTEQGRVADTPTLVLARNYREFLDWCREHDINPDQRHLRYVSSVNSLMGVHRAEFVALPGFSLRPDRQEIETMAASIAPARGTIAP